MFDNYWRSPLYLFYGAPLSSYLVMQ